MTYVVECAVCGLSDELDDVDSVFDLQERHQDRHGDHHVLEFERIPSGDDRDRGP